MCVEGTCSCHEGYQGTSCDIAVCPSKSMFDECSGHGACVLSHLTNETTGDKAVPKCFCEEGFTGSDCSLLGCDEECESNGDAVCRNGVCYCKPGTSAQLKKRIEDLKLDILNQQEIKKY